MTGFPIGEGYAAKKVPVTKWAASTKKT